MRRSIVHMWDYLFDHEVGPLRHITDVSMRHYVLQVLGFIWAVSFCLAIGSYTFLAASIVGHVALIGAAAITVATYTAATVKPDLFKLSSGRGRDGEHD